VGRAPVTEQIPISLSPVRGGTTPTPHSPPGEGTPGYSPILSDSTPMMSGLPVLDGGEEFLLGFGIELDAAAGGGGAVEDNVLHFLDVVLARRIWSMTCASTPTRS